MGRHPPRARRSSENSCRDEHLEFRFEEHCTFQTVVCATNMVGGAGLSGEGHGSRTIALADRNSASDHFGDLAVWRIALAMSFVQFIVRHRRGRWTVRSGDLDRCFADRMAAIKGAVELANESGKSGKPAVVDAEGRGRQFKTIWKYGTDPYPLVGQQADL